MALCAAAHAELLAPKGAKAQLTVEYVFTSSGKYTTGKKERIDIWNVRRVVNMTAQYTADAPQAVAVLHRTMPSRRRRWRLCRRTSPVRTRNWNRCRTT